METAVVAGAATPAVETASCSVDDGAESVFSGRRSNGPPSREREIWILVSLVHRLMDAVRRAVIVMTAILGSVFLGVFALGARAMTKVVTKLYSSMTI